MVGVLVYLLLVFAEEIVTIIHIGMGRGWLAAVRNPEHGL